MFLIAWSALAGIGAGDTVLTQGTGSVSIFAIQLAKAMGAHLIVTTSTEEKFDQAQKLGADKLINDNAEPEWSQTVSDYTQGEGVNRIVELGGR